jgi:hypothetical protein
MSIADLPTFLSRIVGLLRSSDIPCMITGSLVSSLWGDPRTTRDLDLVIEADEPPDDRIREFLIACEDQGWYVSRGEALTPVRPERRQFNVIDPTTGWKADVMWRRNRPFSSSEFSRRQTVEILGATVEVASPEDVVLAKLEWAMSQESRQFDDAVSVLRTMASRIDREYLRTWGVELGVLGLLEAALTEANR